MEPEFKIDLSFSVTTLDGQPYFTADQCWASADYRQVVLLQDALVGALDRLVETGYLHAANKGADVAEGQAAHEVVRGKK